MSDFNECGRTMKPNRSPAVQHPIADSLQLGSFTATEPSVGLRNLRGTLVPGDPLQECQADVTGWAIPLLGDQ